MGPKNKINRRKRMRKIEDPPYFFFAMVVPDCAELSNVIFSNITVAAIEYQSNQRNLIRMSGTEKMKAAKIHGRK
jgi:hypothetical protein